MKQEIKEDYRDMDDDDDDDPISSDISEFSSSISEQPVKRQGKQGKIVKKQQDKKKKRLVLVDTEAEESEGESDLSSRDDIEVVMKRDQERYKEEMLKKKQKTNIIADIEARYKDGEEVDIVENDEQSLSEVAPPDARDAKIWRVGCNKGKENEACMQVMYKCHHLLTSDTPLDIVSCFALKKFPSVLFIEAHFEIHVKNAIEGINNIRQHGFEIVDPAQCPGLFAPAEFEQIALTEGQWVRIRSHNIYQGDLARVMHIDQEKRQAKVKLVPREKREITAFRSSEAEPKQPKQKTRFSVKEEQEPEEIDNVQDEEPERKSKFYHKKKKIVEQKKFVRGPKVAIKTKHIIEMENENDSRFFYSSIRDEWTSAKGDGFIIMKTGINNLLTDKIKPTQEELSFFYPDVKNFKVILKNQYQSLKPIIQTETNIQVGDLVQVEGEFPKYRVKQISPQSGTMFLVKYAKTPEGKKEYQYTVEISRVKLAYSLYQSVVVVNGPNQGISGAIMKLDDTSALISTDANKTIEVLLSDIKIQRNSQKQTAPVEQNTEIVNDNPNKMGALKLNDLVRFGQTDQDVGCVLQVVNNQVKVLDITNTIKNINQMAITSTINTRNNVARNVYGNEIRQHDQVVVLDGFYKNKKAAVLHVYRDYIFLFNGQFDNTQGVIIEKVNNTGLMSANNNSSQQKIKLQNSQTQVIDEQSGASNELKSLVGQYLTIRKGQWQGYRGLVTHIQPKAAKIQLTAKNMTVTVSIDAISKGDQQAVLHQGKTPHHAPGASVRIWDDLDNQRQSVAHNFQSPYAFQTPMHEH